MKNILLLSLFSLICIHSSCRGNDTSIAKKKNTNHKVYTTKVDPYERNIQVALLLDTSNSMDGLIDQAKAQLWEIVNELSYAKCGHNTINLQIALFEYGNDNLKADQGYIRQVLGFSNDLDLISKELFGLNTNGGSEYCGQVIQTSLQQLDWKKSKDHLKLIFIAGNESFTQGSVDYKDVALDANEKNITVNTIFCGNYRQGINSNWKDGAIITKGEYTAIDHNKATVYIATPYDDLILELNNKLNDTYIHYGRQGASKKSLQFTQDQNAQRSDKANAVSRTVSKSSSFYNNKNWDLVDASAETEFNLDDIEEDELPEELKGKNKKEIKSIIDTKTSNRKSIQKQIKDLNSKRMLYLQKQSKGEDNSLGKALIEAIKKQGKEKSFTWD